MPLFTFQSDLPVQRQPYLEAVHWSHDGALIALQLRFCESPMHGNARYGVEVLILDATAGERLQSLRLSCLKCSIQWSTRAQQLLVFGNAAYAAYIMGPQQTVQIPCEAGSTQQEHWESMHWSPCGSFLMAQSTRASMLNILDARSLEVIDVPACLDLRSDDLSLRDADLPSHGIWGTIPSTASQPAVTVAVFPKLSLTVRLSWSYGEWHASASPTPPGISRRSITMAPDASCLLARRKGDSRFWQVDLASHAADQVGHMPMPRFCWAPFPPAWPPICAFIDVVRPVHCVGLTEIRSPQVTRSWSLNELKTMASTGRSLLTGDLTSAMLKWAPSGNHLAVVCSDCTLLLTFHEQCLAA